MRPRVSLAIAAVAFLVLSAPTLAGAGNPPPSNPATSVYVEQIPTGSGPVVAGSEGSSKSLTPRVSDMLKKQGGADASALEKVATSAGLGAPASQTSHSSKGVVGKARSEAPGASVTAPPGASATSDPAPGGSKSATPVFLIALLLVTGMAGAYYWRRQHAARPHSPRTG